MPGDSTLAKVDKAIADIFAPLRKQVALIDQELDRIDEEKAELVAELNEERDQYRAARAKAMRIIAANDRKPKKKTKRATGGRTIGVAPEKIEALQAYITANVGGEKFAGPKLLERSDFVAKTGLGHPSQVSKALGVLHERGVLRLVRSGGIEGLGNRVKVWEVARHGKQPQR